VLSYKLVNAAKHKGCRHMALVGGVAANSRLREKLRGDAAAEGLAVHIPSANLCGDNAAMIAAAGYHHIKQGECGGWDDDVYSRERF